MQTHENHSLDETPYRAFLYEYFGDFFRGIHDQAWQERWHDAVTVTNALADEDVHAELPDEMALAQGFARLFYGVGPMTVPLAQSCWENEQSLHCGDACRKTHDLYARHGLVNDCPDHLPDDHIGIVLPFAAYLLRQGKAEDLQQLIVGGVGQWWPHAEALLRRQEDWKILSPIFSTFSLFLQCEIRLLTENGNRLRADVNFAM